MAAIPFDTLKFVEKLEAGGFTHQQAKAAAEAFADATGQELTTKADLNALRVDMEHGFKDLEQRLVIKLGAMIIALGAFLSMIKFFGHG